jgi:hypothetical protein
VTDGGPVYPDIVVVAKTEELLASEDRSVVSYDGVRDPKAVDDVGEELDNLLQPNSADGSFFDPLKELFDCHEQIVKPPGAFLNGPTMSSPYTAKG